ncbi:helix-turn-helix domain-containing protein [Pseudomonas sp. ML96]|uniref:helix-turn-helix domain-containing protein n=1 Tax=Pseudomonas sp. ML96 TaxID=1523503 RepID=UPI002108AFF6|nr:helix-turn-helix domain-containing protein [Pseudomonas sp. ML96]
MFDTLDVEQQRTAIGGWDQQYAQMSAGRFQGRIVHAQMDGIAAYEERMNTRVEQYFQAPANALVFSFDLSGDTLYLLDSQSRNTWITPENYRETAVVIDLDRLGTRYPEEVLEELALFPLRSPQAKLFGSWLSKTLNKLADAKAPSGGQDLSQQLVEDCLYVLECSLPISDQRQQRRLTQNRKIINRVFELTNAYPEDIFNVLQLAKAAGVSVRQLQQSFFQYTGLAPTAWLRLRRLNAAHRDLLNASPEHTTVAEIAMRRCFWHLGRFAESYRELFGESPRCTLQRRP